MATIIDAKAFQETIAQGLDYVGKGTYTITGAEQVMHKTKKGKEYPVFALNITDKSTKLDCKLKMFASTAKELSKDGIVQIGKNDELDIDIDDTGRQVLALKRKSGEPDILNSPLRG